MLNWCIYFSYIYSIKIYIHIFPILHLSLNYFEFWFRWLPFGRAFGVVDLRETERIAKLGSFQFMAAVAFFSIRSTSIPYHTILMVCKHLFSIEWKKEKKNFELCWRKRTFQKSIVRDFFLSILTYRISIFMYVSDLEWVRIE